MKQKGIRSQVLLIAMVPAIVTTIALSLYFTLLRFGDIEAAFRQRGVSIASQIIPAARYGLLSGNESELKRLTRSLAHDPELAAITIYDRNGLALESAGTAFASSSPQGLPDGWQGEGPDGKTLSFHKKVFSSPLPADDSKVKEATAPGSDSIVGSVTVELSRDKVVTKKREILIVSIAVVTALCVIAGFVAHLLGNSITKPILALEAVVSRYRESVLSSRVAPHGAGVLRNLEEGVNGMVAALELTHKRNIEALSNSAAQLQQQSDFANALLEAQSDAGLCMTIIENGRIISANRAAREFSGWMPDELRQLDVASEIIIESDRSAFQNEYQMVLEGKALSSRFEVGVRTSELGIRWAEIVLFDVRRGDSRRIVAVGVDITQRKLDAEKLSQIHFELKSQRDAAELASKAKSRFLAAASHDLRQPLHALTLFSDQLRERILAPDLMRLSGQIGETIRQMSELLESLLDISKLDLTALKPENQPVEIGPLLVELAEANRREADKKQLRIATMPTSLWVSSDPRYLSRILNNLIANAVRYTNRGGIVIGVRRSGQDARIEIWDSGIGIAPEHIPLVFQEFYQVANPERDSHKGLGLGLAIVDRLAVALGHRILVRSKTAKGSVFSVCVKRAYPEEATQVSFVAEKSDICIMIASLYAGRRSELAALVERWGYAALPCGPDEMDELMRDVLPSLIVCDATCAAHVEYSLQGMGINGMPIVFLAAESDLAKAQIRHQDCSLLEIPVKPSKLRALILHSANRTITA